MGVTLRGRRRCDGVLCAQVLLHVAVANLNEFLFESVEKEGFSEIMSKLHDMCEASGGSGQRSI